MTEKVARDLRGNIIAPYDLPSPDTIRWTASKKGIVLGALAGGIVTRTEVLERYHMTEQELRIWEEGLRDDGVIGLKVTHYQKRKGRKKT